MRFSPRNWVLAATLVVLVVLDLAWPDGRTARRQEPAFPGFDSARATTVRLESGERACELRLVRDRWRVRERDGFAAHQEAVRELLSRLAALSVSDVVATEPASHVLFGIDGSESRLVVGDENGAVLLDARLGRPRDESSGSYVVPAGGTAVHRAASIPLPEPDATRWLDLDLVDLDIPAVRMIRVERHGRPALELVLQEDGRWNVPGTSKFLTQRVVQDLLLVADTTYFEDVATRPSAEVGFDPPAVRLRFELAGGGSRGVELGDELGPHRALRRTDWEEPWVALVRARSAANLEGALARIERALE